MTGKIGLLFLLGLVGGAAAVLVWLVGFVLLDGFWSIAAGPAVILTATWLLADRLLPKIHAAALEMTSLFLWADKQVIEHRDPSTPDGIFRGSALQLVIAYRREWDLDETIDVLRQLKQTRGASARNPDTGRMFTVWLVSGGAQEHEQTSQVP